MLILAVKLPLALIFGQNFSAALAPRGPIRCHDWCDGIPTRRDTPARQLLHLITPQISSATAFS